MQRRIGQFTGIQSLSERKAALSACQVESSEDSMIARAVSNIEEAILMRRSGVMSL
jgi:hypothetical protein